MRRKTPFTAGPEDGQIMVLLIGYVLLTLLLVTVVAASSSVYLGQKKLLALADGAALAAADTFDLHGGDVQADPGTLLTSYGVNAAAQSYLGGTQAQKSLTGVALSPGTGTTDGHTAQVILTGVVHPMFINFLVPDGIPLMATSTARAHLLF